MPDTKKSGPSREYAEEWIRQSNTSASIAASDLGNQCEQGLASCLYLGCIDTLKFICQSLPDIAADEARMVGDAKALKEQLGKLFLWGESLSDGSLDRALGQSEELKKTVLTLLCDIAQEVLSDELLQASPISKTPFLKQLKSDVEPLLDEVQEVIHLSSLESQGAGDETDDDASIVSSINPSDLEQRDSQRQTLSSRIGPLVEDLMDLSPAIESNLDLVPRTVRRIQSVMNAFSVSTPALPYVSVIRDKFPNAASKLVERLGEANWQRHIIVRERMENGVEKGQASDGVNEAAVFSQHGKVSLFHDSGIGTSIPAQSRRAASVASHSSFVSTLAEEGQHKARVPPTPREVDQGIPFECNICHSVQSNIRNRVEWKMHVFADLRPYICTFMDCSDQLLQFPTRSAWAEHEFDEHRVKYVWKCIQCSEELASPEAWKDHLKLTHKSTLTRVELERVLSTVFRCRDASIENTKCHLCQENPGRTRRAIVKHVCRHLEEIALMVLPQDSEDDSDEGSESGSDVIDLAVKRANSHTNDAFSILLANNVQNNLISNFSNDQEVLCRPPNQLYINRLPWLGRISGSRRNAVGGKFAYYIEDVHDPETGFDRYWTSSDQIIPIPGVIQTPLSGVGDRVLARFPETTCFYAGMIIGKTSDGYRVKFEEDDINVTRHVEARYVFPLPEREDEPPEPSQRGWDDRKQLPPMNLPTVHDQPPEAVQPRGDLQESVFPPKYLRKVDTDKRLPSNDRGPKCICGNYTSVGNVIYCQNDGCSDPKRPFHPDCMEVTEDTKRGWLCPDCESMKQRKPEREKRNLLPDDSGNRALRGSSNTSDCFSVTE